MEFALSAGAKLRHAILEYRIRTKHKLDSYLPSTLRSLTLALEPKYPRSRLEEFPIALSKLTFLDMAFCAETIHECKQNLEMIINCLSGLALQCLSLQWMYWSARDLSDCHVGVQDYLQSLTALVSDLFPALRVFALDLPNEPSYWRKMVGENGAPSKFHRISDEDGEEFFEYFRWQWQEEPEENTGLGLDTVGRVL